MGNCWIGCHNGTCQAPEQLHNYCALIKLMCDLRQTRVLNKKNSNSELTTIKLFYGNKKCRMYINEEPVPSRKFAYITIKTIITILPEYHRKKNKNNNKTALFESMLGYFGFGY